MDDNLNNIMLPFLDSKSQFHYLNYYLNKELQEAIDAKLGDEEEIKINIKLEGLYSWWVEEEPIYRYNENYKSDDESVDESDDESDDDSDDSEHLDSDY